jgi:hypothetical protein
MYGERAGSGFNAAAVDQAANLYKRQKLELDATERDAQSQELIRQTARAAVDPNTGEYSLDRHTKLLETNGYPELAQEYRTRSITGMSNAYKAIDAALPHVTVDNWPQKRQELIQAGVPQQALPERYDPETLRKQHQRLGMIVQQYGPLERQATGPQGQGGLPAEELYGQKNLDTGKVENLQTLTPPRQYASGGGGGDGGYAPPNLQKKAEYIAQVYGVPLKVALDIVRNDELGGSRTRLLQAITNTMLSQYATPEEAAAAAKDIVERLYGPGSSDPNTLPGTPRSGGTTTRKQAPGSQGRSGRYGLQSIPITLTDGRVVQQPLLPERPQSGSRTPPPEALRGLAPGAGRPFRDGSVWTVDENGQPVRLR